MKSTTLQQKVIFALKLSVCTLILGVLGWLSFMPSASNRVGAAGEVVISVSVAYSTPAIDTSTDLEVGRSVPISGTSNNVKSVDVYLDKNGDGVLDSDDILMDGLITVGGNGDLSGYVKMPDDLVNGAYNLIVVGHTANTNEGAFPETVQDIVVVNYVNTGPDIKCVYNENSFCLPGQAGQAFGDADSETVIVIDGSDFGEDAVVTVGGQGCDITSASNNKIVCVVPVAQEGQTGAQDIEVCVNGLCDVVKGGFLYKKVVSLLPGVPGTGVFRIGDTIVTTKDMMWWGGLIIILAAAAMLIMIVKSPKKSRGYAKSNLNRKRNYRRQKVAFSSSKKPAKRK